MATTSHRSNQARATRAVLPHRNFGPSSLVQIVHQRLDQVTNDAPTKLAVDLRRPDHPHDNAGAQSGRADLLQQPRLADPRFAFDHDRYARPGDHTLDGLIKLGQLGLTLPKPSDRDSLHATIKRTRPITTRVCGSSIRSRFARGATRVVAVGLWGAQRWGVRWWHGQKWPRVCRPVAVVDRDGGAGLEVVGGGDALIGLEGRRGAVWPGQRWGPDALGDRGDELVLAEDRNSALCEVGVEGARAPPISLLGPWLGSWRHQPMSPCTR